MLFKVLICGLPCTFLRRVSLYLNRTQDHSCQSLALLAADVMFLEELVVLASLDIG